MVPRFLKEIRLRLAHGGFDINIWGTKELRSIAGVSYRRIISLERSGEIPAVRRAENGRLVFSPREAFFLLLTVEIAMRDRLEAYAERIYVAEFYEPVRRAA